VDKGKKGREREGKRGRERGEGKKGRGREGEREGKKGSGEEVLAIPLLVCLRRHCTMQTAFRYPEQFSVAHKCVRRTDRDRL